MFLWSKPGSPRLDMKFIVVIINFQNWLDGITLFGEQPIILLRNP